MAALPEPYRNPFRTSCIVPGAIPFEFRPGTFSTIAEWIDRLEENQWWGSICGRHGSGKSTLVQQSLEELQRRGRVVCHHVLRAGERSLAWDKIPPQSWQAATQFIVDGWEQLGYDQRLQLAARCYRSGAGLLVTSHRPTHMMRVLYRTEVDVDLAWKIVSDLQADSCSPIGRADVERSLKQHRGNLREALLHLYDVFAERAARA